MNTAAKRITRIATAGLALSLLTTPVIAQSVLTADTEISGEAYLNRLVEIMDNIRRLVPETIEGEGPLLTILPETGDTDAELGALSDADRQLVQAGRRLFDLYREVGGNPGGRPLLIQRTANGLFSALEGENGNVSAQPGQALAGRSSLSITFRSFQIYTSDDLKEWTYQSRSRIFMNARNFSSWPSKTVTVAGNG